MIKRFILHILANATALYACTELLDGNFIINGGWKGYLIAAIIFGILNGFIKPLLKIITLPFVFITAGLFVFIINMFLVWFAKYSLDILNFDAVSIQITGGWVIFLYIGILMSIANIVIHWLIKK